ncbi:MAG: alpha/beta fold hydrolase [Bradymonadaceae bacterium]|nr:alpha/beta fold hydrolase [Lujinxingiaceae bacterium]
MPIKQLGHALAEMYYLSLYTACSVAGAFRRLAHHRTGHRRPVVLVPGFLGRGLSYFKLQRALIERGHSVYVVDLGFGVGDVATKSRELEAFLEHHELEDCYLVGHSMGGMISLGMSAQARQRVRHFITLGTAYHGAILSHVVPFFPAARQLKPRSKTIVALAEGAQSCANLTNIVAAWDEIAFPVRVCSIPTCRQLIGAPGHVQLIMSKPALEMVCGVLDELDAGEQNV